MDQTPTSASGEAQPGTTVESEATATQSERSASAASGTARFRSARAPSAPFLVALLLGILMVLVLAFSASALFVFAIGVALAFFLLPIVNRLERRGTKRWVAAVMTVAVAFVATVVLVFIVVVLVVNQGIHLAEELPGYLDDLGQTYKDLDLPDWLRAGTDTIIASAQDNVRHVDQGAVVAGFIGNTLGLVGGFFAWMVLPFFLFYLLKDQPAVAQAFRAGIPEPWKADVEKVMTVTVGSFTQYFRAEFLVGSILFVMVTLGMVVIGLVTDAPLLIDFAILLGAIAFVMELLPQIGPIISYIPALILALASGPLAVIVVSVFYFVVFNIEGSFLVPTFEGRMISFNGASVLVLIAIGFALGGIIGAILILPLASIVRDLFRYFFGKAVDASLVIEPDPSADAASGVS